MNTPTSLVANKIRATMAARGIDIASLSRTTGIGYETTRRRINGQGPLPLTDLYSIADALDIDPTELVAAGRPEGAAA